MFVGHFAVALAARSASPRLRLPSLFAAVAFLDIVWPLFILLGIEHARVTPGFTAFSFLDLYDFPYSHSLVCSLGWSLLFAAPWFARKWWREAWIVAGCVFSHFVLDLASHAPDMPLWPGGSMRLGLGLWNSIPATIGVEGSLFAGSIALYLRATRATRSFGTWGFWALVVLFVLGWLGGAFAPPPPNIQTVAVSGLVLVPLILLWAARIEAARVL